MKWQEIIRNNIEENRSFLVMITVSYLNNLVSSQKREDGESQELNCLLTADQKGKERNAEHTCHVP